MALANNSSEMLNSCNLSIYLKRNSRSDIRDNRFDITIVNSSRIVSLRYTRLLLLWVYERCLVSIGSWTSSNGEVGSLFHLKVSNYLESETRRNWLEYIFKEKKKSKRKKKKENKKKQTRRKKTTRTKKENPHRWFSVHGQPAEINSPGNPENIFSNFFCLICLIFLFISFFFVCVRFFLLAIFHFTFAFSSFPSLFLFVISFVFFLFLSLPRWRRNRVVEQRNLDQSY